MEGVDTINSRFGKPHQFFWYSPCSRRDCEPQVKLARPNPESEALREGEPLVQQHLSIGNFNTIYFFNSKELDEEPTTPGRGSSRTHQFKNNNGCEQTGLYYYGDRYYNPKFSQWLSVDPLATQFPSWTPYHFVHNNPINLIDPDGRSAWEPDANGNLVSEAEDNAESLAREYNMTVEQASKLIDSQGLEKNEDGSVKAGQTLKLDNVFTRSINNSDLDYNCFGSSLVGSINKPINNSAAIGCAQDYDNILTEHFESVDYEDAVFGKTVIRFSSSSPHEDMAGTNEERTGCISRTPGTVGSAIHSAVYYGTSKNGTVYVYTKNGFNEPPKVMPILDLINNNPDYGNVGGMIGDNTGYYLKK